jgi:zeta-carotene desaturase
VPKEQILETIIREVRECLPEARDASLTRSHVIRWPKATLSPLPGVDAFRPDQRSPIENLFIAGEWTRTGWPSTMESAARSGYLAAACILNREAHDLLAPDLPASRLSRLLCG